jgi:photosystem II stability/assembly factor-like uncharacterized protein
VDQGGQLGCAASSPRLIGWEQSYRNRVGKLAFFGSMGHGHRMSPIAGLLVGVFLLSACESPTAIGQPNLTSVHMVNRTTGWATTTSSVLRTTDGGDHWVDLTPSAASPLRTSFFLNASDAWIESGAAANPVGEALPPATVFRTIDGGQHWERGIQAVGLGKLTFADRQRGWSVHSVAIGTNQHVSSLQTTSDGGIHWTEVASTGDQRLDRACDIAGATFLNATTLWVAGTCPPVQNSPQYLAVSHDGGKSFNQQRFTLPPSDDPSAICPCEARPPQFFSAKDGIFTLHYGVTQYDSIGRATAYVSHDGGESWTISSLPSASDLATAFPDVNIGWQLDQSGDTLYHTRDGQHWVPIATNPSLGGKATIQFVDERNGWVLQAPESPSSMATLMRSRDGGRSWQLQVGPLRRPVVKLAVSCRLPIDGLAPDSGPAAQNGFVSFPAGQASIDPSGALSYDQAGSRFTTLASPSLSGWGSSSYSRPLARWLPVQQALVSSDGLTYAWTEAIPPDSELRSADRIHVVDGRTGADRAVSNPPSQLDALAYTAEGIYAVNDELAPIGFNIISGLWLIDPQTGATREIRNEREAWRVVTNEAVWGTDTDSTFPHDPQIASAPGRLLRLDRASKKVEVWLTRANASVEAVGFDSAGNPLVELISGANPNAAELWLVSAANQATLVASVKRSGGFHPVADQHGVWFAGDDGIFLYTLTTGARRVAAVGGFPAGPCA